MKPERVFFWLSHFIQELENGLYFYFLLFSLTDVHFHWNKENGMLRNIFAIFDEHSGIFRFNEFKGIRSTKWNGKQFYQVCGVDKPKKQHTPCYWALGTLARKVETKAE